MEKLKMKEKAASLCRGKLSYVFLGVAVLLTVALGVTVAKYVQTKNVDPNEADAAKFYFASDVLQEEVEQSIKTYHLSFADLNDASITFKLQNFQDDLNWSGTDITYDIECQVDSTARKTVRSGQILSYNKSAKTETTITLTAQDLGNLRDDSVVTVQAIAKAPYSATLIAKFIITRPETTPTIVVNDSAGSNVVQVMMQPFFTNNNANTYYFTYPSKAKDPSRYCIVDKTDERLVGNGKGVVEFTAYSGNAYTFVFFKADPSDVFKENDFQLTTKAAYDADAAN